MKNNKAPAIDKITAEVLKTGGEPMISILHMIFKKIWDQEQSPKYWQNS